MECQSEQQKPTKINILDHIGYVKHIANRYKRTGNMDDIIQEGMEGLVVASMTYDPKLGVPFMGYARWKIIQYISKYVRRYDRLQQREQELEPVNPVPVKPKYIAEPYQLKIDIAKLRDIIDKLPESQAKRVIVRRYFSERADGEVVPLREIAQELGISFQAALQNEQRGFQHIRKELYSGGKV